MYSHGAPKPRDRGKEAQVMMMPMRNAYIKVIKMQKHGIQTLAEINDNVPKLETNSESSHLETEPANCENEELISQLNQTVIFESTESEQPPSPEPETEVEIPDALSYMRESPPQSSSSEKSSHTPTGDSIEDPDDVDERRKLQEELLAVSGIMDKSMITNEMLDSLNVEEMMKSVDIKASQIIIRKEKPIEDSIKDKLSVMSEIISVEDLP